MAQPIPLSRPDDDQTTSLPQNIEAEAALLGAMMIDNRVAEDVMQRLKADHFYEPVHGRVFDAIVDMVSNNRVANPVTLKPLFQADSAMQELGGLAYLAQLTSNPASLIGARSFAEQIYDLAMLRALVTVGRELVEGALDTSQDINPSKQIESAEMRLYEVAETGESDSGAKSFSRAATMAVKQAERAMNSGGGVSGITSGLTDFNAMTGGLNRSDLIILAGRPGMGKSALATTMAFHSATTTRTGEEARPVAFFSLEMSAEQLGTRILSERARIDSNAIRQGDLNAEEFDRLVEVSNQLSVAPFYIDDTPSLSVSQVASRARRMKRTGGLGLIVVDYLQLLTPQLGVKSENRVQEISNISRSLKAIAKELDVPVLALSQLSRAVEQREDKRPNLSDLRESGSIEQDADVVLFIYREEYYLNKKDPERDARETEEQFNAKNDAFMARLQAAENKAEVIIAKQRHGPVGSINVHFEKSFTHFSDLTDDSRVPDHF